MKKLLSLLTIAAAVCVCAAEKCDIGGKFGNFPSPIWINGSTPALQELYGGKKFLVVYIWQPDQAALADFPRIVTVAEKYNKKVAFSGIAIGSADRIKRFPGANRLTFPMNIDPKGAIASRVTMPAKLPVALILDDKNTLLWSGATAAVPMILDECLSGKFDLKEEIRKNVFARAVNEAVKAQKFEEAYKLLNKEWKKSCDSLELLNAQITLLTRKLNRPNDAFALAHEAQQKNPRDHRFYEAEYRLLGNPAHAKRLPGFFARVKKAFAGQPGVLMAFAIAEMGRPAEDLDMKLVISLAETGWNSKGFKRYWWS